MIEQEVRDRLVVVAAELAQHTRPECAGSCLLPHSCCHRTHCESTTRYAREEWGVDVSDRWDDTRRVPLLGPQGCLVEPHLRPLCTVHTCAVSAFGGKPNDVAWNQRYWRLRRTMDDLEWELASHKAPH